MISVLIEVLSWRNASCARMVPPTPPAHMIASGLPASGESLSGHDAQSIAFFSTPGIEPLYSGVSISNASAAFTARPFGLSAARW